MTTTPPTQDGSPNRPKAGASPSLRWRIVGVVCGAVLLPVALAAGALYFVLGGDLTALSWIAGLGLAATVSCAVASMALTRLVLRPLNDLRAAISAADEAPERLSTVHASGEALALRDRLVALVDELDAHRRDTSDQRASLEGAIDALEHSEARLRSIISQVSDGVVVANRYGIIESINGAAEAMFGHRAAQVVGQPVRTLMPEVFGEPAPTRRDDEERTKQIAMQVGSGVKTQGVRRDGSTFPMECSVNVVTANGEILFTWITHDITARVQAEQAMAAAQVDLERRVEARTSELQEAVVALRREAAERKRAEDEALRASRAKSEFLANMSHELRTPLNAIIGYTELIAEEAEEAGHREFLADLRKIHRSAHHLLLLINDVLDLSKIEAGKMEVNMEEITVAALIDEVAATVEPLAGQNRNTLRINVSPRVQRVPADPTKLRQALFNTLSNACKFTRQGTITLNVALVSRDARPWVAFEVVDTGIGIAADKLDKLFSPFVQEDASTTRKYGGTGLGLSISRSFCQMMGGDLTVSSVKGEGSTFTILLPLHNATAQLHAVRRQQSERVPARVPAPTGPRSRGLRGDLSRPPQSRPRPSASRSTPGHRSSPPTAPGSGIRRRSTVVPTPRLDNAPPPDADQDEAAVMDPAILRSAPQLAATNPRPVSREPARKRRRSPLPKPPPHRDSGDFFSVRQTLEGAPPDLLHHNTTGNLRKMAGAAGEPGPPVDHLALLSACDLLDACPVINRHVAAFDEAEASMLRRVDGRTTIRALVDNAPLGPSKAAEVLVALLERGVLST